MKKFLIIALCFGATFSIHGQRLSASEGLIPPGMKAGPVNGSYPLSGFDSVNLFNGKVSFAFPLMQLGGRGESGYTMTVPVESTNWQIIDRSPPEKKYVDSTWDEVPDAGLGPGYLYRRSIGYKNTCALVVRDPQIRESYTTYVLSRPGGGTMEFYPRQNPTPKTWDVCLSNEADFQRGTVYQTRDGSSATLFLTSSPVESPYSGASNGFKSGGEPTGYVLFKNGLRYNIVDGETRSIVDRNGNRVDVEYHPSANTPRSVSLNLGGTTGQSFDVNLPSTLRDGQLNLAGMTQFRIDLRVHNVQQPSSTLTSVIWSSNNGNGPKLVLRNGILEAQLSESGATAGCSVSIGSRSEVVVRFQRQFSGQYQLSAWDYAPGVSAPFQSATCPLGTTAFVNLSGLMSIGSDAGRTSNSFFKGQIAYLRVYSSALSAPALSQPNGGADPDVLLGYEFNAPLHQYRLDTASLQHLTSYGNPQGQFTPNELAIGTGLLKRVTDPLGRVVDVGLVEDVSTTLKRQTISYQGYAGSLSPRTIKVESKPLAELLSSGTIMTYGQMFGNTFSNAETTYDEFKTSRIELSNGSFYGFKYNSCGEVTQVRLPTGGLVEYDWDGLSGEANGFCKGLAPSQGGIQRYLTERREIQSDATVQSKTSYSRVEVKPCVLCPNPNDSDTIVVAIQKDGAGTKQNISRHYYYNVPHAVWDTPLRFPGWLEGKEYRSEVLKTELPDWKGAIPAAESYQRVDQKWYDPPGTPATNYLTAEEHARGNDVITTLSEGGNVVSKTDSREFDEYNNLTLSISRNWGGAIVSQRRTTYKKSPYIEDAVHIRGLVDTDKLEDGGSVRQAQADYFYDEATPLDRTETILGRESGFGTSRTLRGNATRVSQWRSDTATQVETKQEYDILGNVVAVTDANNNKISIDMTDVFSASTQLPATSGKTFAFPTAITYPVPGGGSPLTTTQQTKGTYDRYLGRLTSSTDLNNISATYTYDDPLDRVKTYSKLTDQLTFSYPSMTRVEQSTVQNSCGASQTLSSAQEFDGFGRVLRTKLTESGTATINTKVTYDGLGRAFEQTQPFRSSTAESSAAKTVTTFDWLGRPVTTTSPGGAIRRYAYRVKSAAPSGTETFTRDEAGKQTRSLTDGLGRLIEVTEDPKDMPGYPNAAGLEYVTSYTYDSQGNLKTVTQGTLDQRIYTYNSLGWLISASNPETGLFSYDYYSNGSLKSRSDQRGAKVEYALDKWNRVWRKTYTKGSAETTNTVNYTYDAHTTTGGGTSYPKGQLTQVAVEGGTVVRYDQIDALGRLQRSTQVTDNESYEFFYSYNAAGGLESMQYPKSGRIVTTCYDGAGRVLSLRNGGAGSTDVYAEVASGTDPETNTGNIDGYAAFGAAQRVKLESGKYVQKWGFNERLQMGSAGLFYTPSAGAGSPMMRLGLGYGSSMAANNGNVLSQEIRANANGQTFTATQVYGYDSLNRLETAVEGPWKQRFEYDRWGNRWIDTANTSGIAVASGTPISASAYLQTKNRLNVPADAAGNLSVLPGRVMKYDVENRVVSVDGANPQTMEYDGDGRRVLRTAGAVKTVYVYSADGQLALERTTGMAITMPTGRRYLFTDHLGSTRMVVDTAGVAKGWWDYAPFGDEVPKSDGRAGIDYYLGSPVGEVAGPGFTGQVRDRLADGLGTGLDYFVARYFHAGQGRFASPDRPFVDQNPGDPQSWNLYAYVRNRPLGNVDPSGQACVPNSDRADLDLNNPKNFHDDNSGGQSCKDAFAPGGSSNTNAAMNTLPTALSVSEPPVGPLELSTKPSDYTKLTNDQCTSIRIVLQREANFGTPTAARMSSNTLGDATLWPFNSTYVANLKSPIGELDLDWYTDMTGYSAGFQPVVYPIAKTVWSLGRPVIGLRVGNPLPFQDPGERTAFGHSMGVSEYVATGQPVSVGGYRGIFTTAWMAQACPGR